MTVYRRYSVKQAQVVERERALWLAQPMTARCFCGKGFRGVASAVIEEVANHRRDAHPNLVRKALAQRKLLRKHHGKVRV